MKKILGIMFIGIVLVAGVFVHNSIYSISEENIKQNIQESLNNKECKLEFLKEECINGGKAIIFSTNDDESDMGLAILDKGLNNQYRVVRVINGSNRYTTYKKYLLSEYIIEAGDNRIGDLSYIGVTNGNKEIKKINIEKDFFIKFINIDKLDGYNFYNNENKVVDI